MHLKQQAYPTNAAKMFATIQNYLALSFIVFEDLECVFTLVNKQQNVQMNLVQQIDSRQKKVGTMKALHLNGCSF